MKTGASRIGSTLFVNLLWLSTLLLSDKVEAQGPGNRVYACSLDQTGLDGTVAAERSAMTDLDAPVLHSDHLWTEKPVVAKRLRQRIGAVMRWAVAQGYRENNPAGDAVGAVLPKHNGSTTHFRALPHRRVGEAIATVRESNTWRGIKLGFEFMVLTAARTVEVRLATWDEIDMDAARWTIPPEHMKAKREHRVPLSHRAVELLGEAAERFSTEGLLFPGPTGKPFSGTSLYKMLTRLAVPSTAHGFRSSFRDWAAEKTDHPREVAEAALAHVVKNKVEAAYRRTDLFERRRRLMDEWAEYLAGRRESTAAYRL